MLVEDCPWAGSDTWWPFRKSPEQQEVTGDILLQVGLGQMAPGGCGGAVQVNFSASEERNPLRSWARG